MAIAYHRPAAICALFLVFLAGTSLFAQEAHTANAPPPPGAKTQVCKDRVIPQLLDITKKAGVASTGFAMGGSVGDYNNDGWPDLFITNLGQNVLYRNNGDGTFTDVTKEAGLSAGSSWSTGSAWADYDGDGNLDLLVSA